jgi:hypothetical protein
MTSMPGPEALVTRIETIIGPFADTSSPLAITSQPDGSLVVRGSRHFRSFELRLVERGDPPTLVQIHRRKNKVEERSLASLLSTPGFGNLDALARSMLTYLKARLGDPPKLVESKLVACSDDPHLASCLSGSSVPAFGTLRSILASRPAAGTNLAFLHGHAGSGKSWLLMNTAFEQAQNYLSREVDQLYLYVDAQGVNLRSLEQQISYQLDVFNGILRFGEVVPLIRLGALSLIVDGFDELIMPSGYNDTLNALCSYLDSLKGEGAVLASARTAFFNIYDLQAAGARISQPLVQTVVEVQPWGQMERREFCEMHNLAHVAPRLERIAEDNSSAAGLLGRPFVVSALAHLLDRGEEPQESEVMLAIEQSFLERERTQKLLDPVSHSPLLTDDEVRRLFSEIALEMWHLRQTTIDTDSLRTLTDLVLEECSVRQGLREVVIQRIELNPILQLTQTMPKNSAVQFPHEMLFSRFLAYAILVNFAGPKVEIFSILREAPLSESVLEQVALLASHGSQLAFGVQEQGVEPILRRIEYLGEEISARPDDANIRINLGAIAGVLLPHRLGGGPLKLSRCEFLRTRFAASNLAKIGFHQCLFDDIDAQGTDWSGSDFSECPPITKMSARQGQAFPNSLPEVVWLVLVRPAVGPEDYFGSRQTRTQLFPDQAAEGQVAAGQGDSLSEAAIKLAQLAEKAARRAIRVFWIAIEEDDSEDAGLRALKRNQYWPKLVELLGKHGLARIAVRQRRGATPEMMHVELAREILLGCLGTSVGLPRAVVDFWNEIKAM